MAKKIQRTEPIINLCQNMGGNWWFVQIIDMQGNVVLIDEKHVGQCIQELAVAENRIKIYKVARDKDNL